MRFGHSSSEHLDTEIAQLELTLEELEACESQLATPISTPATSISNPAERVKPVAATATLAPRGRHTSRRLQFRCAAGLPIKATQGTCGRTEANLCAHCHRA